jgi:isopentenyl diphosphate isomerase/L-lactate dehydrogenase-like FMN-dependent dehydrogenase
MVGFAGHFLRAADQNGVQGVIDLAEVLSDELRVAMFCTGAKDLAALAETPLHTQF